MKERATACHVGAHVATFMFDRLSHPCEFFTDRRPAVHKPWADNQLKAHVDTPTSRSGI
mgnify:CR=1 FL=1